MRQMRMKMESPDALQEIKSIRPCIDFDGSSRPVRHFRRPKSKLIGHGNTQITKQRLGKAAQALLPRNSNISVMVEFHFLPREDLISGNAVDVTNVVMRTNKQCVARIVHEFTKGRQLTFAGMLTRALRIETDDDQYVDAVENFAVERRYFAVRGAALDNSYDIARADPHILAK